MMTKISKILLIAIVNVLTMGFRSAYDNDPHERCRSQTICSRFDSLSFSRLGGSGCHCHERTPPVTIQLLEGAPVSLTNIDVVSTEINIDVHIDLSWLSYII